MTKIGRFSLMILLMSLSACAHLPSSKEFKALQAENQVVKSQNAALTKDNADLRQRLASYDDLAAKAAKYDDCLQENQNLLDKNIICLEENKLLIEQIGRFKQLGKKDGKTKLDKDYDYLEAQLERERQTERVSVLRAGERIRIILPQRALFSNERSAWLTPKGTRLTEKVAAVILKTNPAHIEIAGHTDNVAIPESLRGTYPSNWELGMARALAVLKAFSIAKTLSGDIHLSSYGQSQPVADNGTEEGRAMNRRVEIIIQP
ncbi:MAG: putative lipoprotein YiaD precursor [Deltaproteobacteria bacterium ADurb.Bin510]|nr:MAG: putative lipoprotein YiaD precursor [Deltaproteobacteria bacterium ADurb.Bin510]